MSIDLDSLRELYQGYSASKRPPSRIGCPDPAEIVDSFGPRASKRQKAKIIDHISQCPLCREEFLMLIERRGGEAAAAGSPDGPALKDRRGADEGSGRRSFAAFSRLAGALLGMSLVIFSLVVIVRQRERWNVLRSQGPAIRLLAPRPGQTVSKPPVCRWQTGADAETYVLELFDEELLPVWTSDPVRVGELKIPDDVFAGLQPGHRYFWMVTGYSGRAPAAESPMGRFVVSRSIAGPGSSGRRPPRDLPAT